jgi:hypothetical protein
MKGLQQVSRFEMDMILFKVNKEYLHTLPEGPVGWSKVEDKNFKSYSNKAIRIELPDNTIPATLCANGDNRVTLDTKMITDACPYLQFECFEHASDYIDKIGGIALC